MIALGIGVALFLIGFFFAFSKDDGGFAGVGFMFLALSIFFNLWFSAMANGVPETRAEYDLVMIDDNYVTTSYGDSGTEVSFVANIPSDSGPGYYTSVFSEYSSDDNVRIIETSGGRAYMAIQECVSGDRFLLTVFTFHSDCRYDLYVPAGTAQVGITQEDLTDD